MSTLISASNIFTLRSAMPQPLSAQPGFSNLQSPGFSTPWMTKALENLVFFAVVAFVIAVQITLTGEACGRW